MESVLGLLAGRRAVSRSRWSPANLVTRERAERTPAAATRPVWPLLAISLRAAMLGQYYGGGHVGGVTMAGDERTRHWGMLST